ncbi:hypothetical protein HYC85_010147 [Camellia sinensis]|uniref:RING-type E3 ubiquitin transferase n=1 Tax=Camellia sinensis TaxID=4442 RepID=A0A7J7HH98_CAMSI|nr:hypothetical protein HYC85_010147 [Camellia sinensis]
MGLMAESSEKEAMDDTCAVCAETLEWAAYGQCGHHEVCSTCIARLRFICDDRRCCICKSESNIIFVTKALGDYTRMINDFSIFPVDPTEGQVGPYWYHEGTQAFFDDLDHYKMITGMCKLSCNVCDKKDDLGSEDLKRRGKFRKHCATEEPFIFICEQKLYTRAQLNRHINFGDSEVDGSESERGGFMGHPMCEFCRNPFYGDNELYTHMSTEHYTCHIHFRQEHFLCEDEACLEKKFIVFATESEMKRHNAMEHGGRMSRSKRNAAFQIPISFQYRSSRERDQNRRGRVFQPDYSDSQLSLAIEASLATANANMPRATSSRAQTDSDHRETGEINSILESFESLASADSEPSSRHRQAMGQNSRNNTPLETSSFPPLPVAARNNHQKQRNGSEGLGRNTMAARLRHRNHVTVLNASQARPTASRQPTSLIVGSSQLRPISSFGHVLSSGSASSITKPATVNEVGPSNFSSSMQIRSTTADAQSASSASSSTKTRSSNKVSHSTSTPNLVDRGSLDPAVSEFPPVSATRPNKLTKNTQPLPKAEDVRTANKSLVQRIRSDLEFDEDKYAAFKVISSEYRQGLIDTGEYVAYVFQFGLSHLIPELARLCPDAQKQKELVEAYSICSLRGNGPWENSAADNSGLLKHKKSSKKGKEKCEDNGISSSNGALEDSIINSLRELQSNYKPSKEVEVLSKDGYRSAKGKSTNLDDDDDEQRVKNHSEPAADGLKKSSGTSGGGNKPRKKTSKFNRVRLGEGSQAAVLDLTNSDSLRDSTLGQSDGNTDASERLPVRGAWKNGGGRRLVANLR